MRRAEMASTTPPERPRTTQARAALLLVAWSSLGRADDVVVTGTRTPESARGAAVRVDVVDQEEIRRRGALTVADALASQPGVRVAPGDYGYLGGVSALQIQGFDRDRVLILEDGERVIGDVGGAIDLSSLPTTDISQIEIVTGPQSALYGSSAIGGVVNIRTGMPRLPGPSGRAQVEARSRGGLVARATGAMRDGTRWVQIEGGTTRSGEVAGAGSTPLLPQVWRYQMGLRAGAQISDHWSVRARARWLRDDSSGRDEKVVPGLGTFTVQTPERGDRTATQIIAERAFVGGSGLRLAAASQTYEGQSDSVYAGSTAGSHRERSYRLDSLEPILTVADGKRTWTAGVRLESEQFVQKLTTDTIGTTTSSDEVPRASRRSGAAYAQLAWKLTPSLTILPGVRHETHSRYGQATTPRLSIAYRAPRVVVRAGVGRGYRAPSAKEIGFVFDHSFYGYKVEGNTNLRPESSWGVTGDSAIRVSDSLDVRVGAFANRIEQMIDIDLGAPSSSSNGVSTYTYRNLGRAHTAGGQIGLTVRAPGGLRSDIAYDFLWTRDETSGAPIAGRPRHSGLVALHAPLFARLAVTARWRAFSDAYVDGVHRSPAYSSLDLRVERSFSSGTSLYAGSIHTLDDRSEPGRTGDLRPPLGRTLYVGLRLEAPAQEEP